MERLTRILLFLAPHILRASLWTRRMNDETTTKEGSCE